MKLARNFLAAACLLAAGFGPAAHAGAVSVLAGKPGLTPEIFIRAFAKFTFELNAQPQDAETFLQRQRGDCDDFASLASRLLTERGYKTKLVMVMMDQQTHVVCYVKEAQGFLDFNHRADAQPIIKSDGSLADIAQKVAGDFRQRWHTAAEFKYNDKSPVYLEIVFPTAAVPRKAVAAVTPASERARRHTNDVVAPRPVSTASISPETVARTGISGVGWRKRHLSSVRDKTPAKF